MVMVIVLFIPRGVIRAYQVLEQTNDTIADAIMVTGNNQLAYELQR
jgi:hypothetical protein